jgi:RNA polymerase sigma factor (sigma-70 family)
VVASEINSLFEQARLGDPAKESLLFKALTARFRLFTRQRIWNQVDADEVVQEALTAISREYKGQTFTVSFSAWAYKVLDYRILDYMQRQKRRSGKIDQLPADESVAAVHLDDQYFDLKRRLLACLEKVGTANVRYARILNLHYHGYTTEEICGRLELTATNFYTVLSRARSLLAMCLQQGDIST